ncbi:hypothetical protein NSQ85_06145 [Streptococcus sp. FSL L8-0526]|uniref:hypothetical protein n=1 Tax=Streptococcus sp. FSL L8-0526 TaxID=2954690 RepID=UPI0030FBA856
MTETESFKQGVTLGSILHCFFSAPLFYLNGKEIQSLDGLDLNNTMVTSIYIDYLGNLTLELEGRKK